MKAWLVWIIIAGWGGCMTVAAAPRYAEVFLAQRRVEGQWSGSGQIVSGPGNGGTIRLSVIIDGEHYRSTEGPRLDLRTAKTNFNDQGNQWSFQVSGRALNVTLVRRNGQVINFTLVPVQ